MGVGLEPGLAGGCSGLGGEEGKAGFEHGMGAMVAGEEEAAEVGA